MEMKNDTIEFSGIPAGSHKCTSEVQGDWVVFRCEHCPDYERRINWKTGETTVKGAKEIQHYSAIGDSLAQLAFGAIGDAIINPSKN